MIARDGPQQVGRIDHLLAAVGATLATYCTGMSIGKPVVANFFAIGTLIMAVAGYLLAQKFRNQAVTWDTGLFAGFGIAAAVLVLPLNGLTPGGGYPRELIVAGMLSWMILMCSVVAWRDSTLLFLAVPSIALFGLTGCFDTYGPATPLFFVFLICASTLFARAHYRSMLRLAQRSYAASSAFAGESLTILSNRLESGPWRWMAGPAWGLVSAGVVVAISVIGAPVIQKSVEPIASAVKINLPIPPGQNRIVGNRFAGGDAAFRVGLGPRSQLSDRVVIHTRLDKPRYLRGSTYIRYTGIGWESDGLVGPGGRRLLYDFSPNETMPDGRSQPFSIMIAGGIHDKMYFPGEPLIGFNQDVLVLSDGTVRPPQPLTRGVRRRAIAYVSDDDIVPYNVGTPPHYGGSRMLWDASRATKRVRDLVAQVTKGERTDYARAMAIKRSIESRVMYNLNAPAIGRQLDAVDTFLFKTKQGYCDLFASAMALMARCANMPSRVVTGFFPISGDKDQEGRYLIRESDYHAWAEIYFEGVGWVAFDPTEGASAVEGGERGNPSASFYAWYERSPTREFLLGGSGLIALFAIGYLLRSGKSAVPEATDRRTRRLHSLVKRFQSHARHRVGRPRQLHETLQEYTHSLSSHFRHLAAEFEGYLYGPEPPSDDKLSEFGLRVKHLAKEKA
ncbi:MAG: hypothetical protein HONBIEJF_02986 [Fimbriimonadaceae bacterium]|nr:hypothetical protein [Fimbriimonadaceae bacterium]